LIKYRVLWITNYVTKEMLGENTLNSTVSGGWLEGYISKFLESEMELNIIAFADQLVFDKKAATYKNGTISLNIIQRKKGRIDYDSLNKFENMINKINPDIVHFHGSEYLFGHQLVEKTKDFKKLITIQGLTGKIANSFFDGFSFNELIKRPLLSAELMRLKVFFGRVYKNEAKMITNIEFFTGRTFWDKSYLESINPKGNYYRLNYGLRREFYKSVKWSFDKTKNHIYINTMTPSYKGLHSILKSLKLLKTRYPDIKFYMPLGTFNRKLTKRYRAYLSNEIRKLSLSESIVFMSTMTSLQVVETMLSCKLIIVPSTVENASATLCEAQYLGLPVIAAFTGGMTELFEHNTSGFYFNLKDYDVLYKRCVDLIENKELSIEFSSRGILKAEARHNIDVNFDDLLSIYNVIGSK
jgi:L-malate glycosyltransferase